VGRGRGRGAAVPRRAVWVRRRAPVPTGTAVVRVRARVGAKGRRTRGRAARVSGHTAGKGLRGGAGAAQGPLRVLAEEPLAAPDAAAVHSLRPPRADLAIL